jgi:predicted Zn-dependent protease
MIGARRRRRPPEALANATPYAKSGRSIHVHMDRLLVGRDERLTTAVLAHEITHVLERINRHSADGVMVMKDHWFRLVSPGATGIVLENSARLRIDRR